jgi:hypothetical protein
LRSICHDLGWQVAIGFAIMLPSFCRTEFSRIRAFPRELSRSNYLLLSHFPDSVDAADLIFSELRKNRAGTAGGLEISAVDGNHVIDLLCGSS